MRHRLDSLAEGARTRHSIKNKREPTDTESLILSLDYVLRGMCDTHFQNTLCSQRNNACFRRPLFPRPLLRAPLLAHSLSNDRPSSARLH